MMAYRPLHTMQDMQQAACAARQLIDDASLGPEASKAIKDAFDAVWREISGNFSSHPITVRVARRRLAEALLSLATDTQRDVEALKRGALEMMCAGRGNGLVAPSENR
jgi:hypothetical protein